MMSYVKNFPSLTEPTVKHSFFDDVVDARENFLNKLNQL